MTRPRIQQLHQSGATDGQLVAWSAALGYWVPAGSVSYPCRAAFTASGGERLLNIGAAPIANTEQVFVNGLLKRWAVDYVLAGSIITLTSPLAGGDVLLLRYSTGSACGVATLTPIPTGFHRPMAVRRPVRRHHRIR